MWFSRGTPFIWLSAAAISTALIMVMGLILLITIKGLGHFWPMAVAEFGSLDTKTRLIGQVVEHKELSEAELADVAFADRKSPEHLLLKIGNRDFFNQDFRWVYRFQLNEARYPEAIMVAERREWGNLYGYLVGLFRDGEALPAGSSPAESDWERLQRLISESNRLIREAHELQQGRIRHINYQLERLQKPDAHQDDASVKEAQIHWQQQYAEVERRLESLYREAGRFEAAVQLADGREVRIPLAKVVRAYQPNAMSWAEKIVFYAQKLWEFVSQAPREANTEGGVFPALFGTVLMVLIMTIMVVPFGVIAAVYLHEYARQSLLTRVVRVSVNNLAGVPSIVYGVFGLGFFVYLAGGNLDQWLFSETLPAPTLGTPGLIWASMTLALLTMPVVIVATEEGLSRVPQAVRAGSLALGATREETLWRIVLPMTVPAIMTGLILAVARAAGEVAPLMLVGVVKLAPSLPIDGHFPYFHLERKFMHLGFHIYDVGFQSPNVEAARPLVYATALLLLLVIIVLNLAAIVIRNRLREKYSA